MESKFAHLRERDASVSMLRVKMSRRRSQSQKENRERAVNTRRNLDKVPELEVSSMDITDNMPTIHERTVNSKKAAKDLATEERIKQLGRWKERKALEKEKEQRERERKGVFKTGMFHPKDYLNNAPQFVVPSRAKETKLKTAPSQTTRVTRSMKEPVPRSTFLQPTVAKKDQPKLRPKTKVCSVEPSHRALSTRSANMPPVTAAPVLKVKPEDVRTTRSRTFIKPKVPAPNTRRNCKATADNTVQPAEPKEAEEKTCPPSPTPCLEKDMEVDQAPEPVEASSSVSSFAPKGFVFQAPVLLSCFKFEPLTPRSADAFLKPSPSFILPAPPMFELEPQAEQSGPSPTKSPRRSPARTVAPPTPDNLLESKHDVPYFRSEISNETDKLTTLCVHWEPKVENESIPEEMRDRMRTAVGQARLLMKERFKQFTGLVDDCELGRGDKITTCTDLQGFWDMVYYQVEDVEKKFEALKVAESRDWVEEYKPPPPPRQRKVVKKPAAAKPPVNKAAVGSRLAAVKAAMKAKRQAAEAEKAAKDAGNEGENPSLTSQEPQPKAEAQPADMVVFDGGFFQVESPAKPSGSARRSSRRHAAVLPQDSPRSNNPTPRRVSRRPRAVAQTPGPAAVASPALPVLHTPAHIRLTLDHTPAPTPKSERGTPQSSRSRRGTTNVSLCFTPVREMLPADTQAEGSPETAASTQETPASVPQLSTPTPVRSLPTITVVEEQDQPAEAVHDDMSLSPRLSLSPCKPPLAPEPSVSLSFTLSPCVSPIQPPISCPPAVQDQESVCVTPDSSVVEELPGLDFERYLQPSLRCSMSPGETVAIETLSPMAVDVEMESPRGHSDDLPTQQEPAQPEVSSVLTLQSPQVPTAQSAMLLFTPDLKDRIRQSVCPSDLMVFTPPF